MGFSQYVNEPTRDLILQALRAGRYSLLLGAGFSAASQSRDGRPLPTGGQLAQELSTAFRLPENKYTLSALCGAIEPERRNSFFKDRFLNCIASPGAALVPSFVWRHIFTFNVDDVLASAYSKPNALQKPEFFTARQPFGRPDDPADLFVVHLHGYVRRPDDGYVFSTAEYGSAAQQDSVWFKIAVDELALQPFMVLGCALDEPDVEYYLAARSGFDPEARQVPPSLFITRSMDAVLEARCRRFGMIPVQADSESFLNELATAAGKRPSPLELIRPSFSKTMARDMPEKEQRIFFRQWLFVRNDELPLEAPAAPLLTGVEPTWAHIRNGEAVVRQDVQRVVERVSSWIGRADRKSQTLILSAASGQGKTATLLHSAHELAQMDLDVYYYIGKERLNNEAIVTILRAIGRPSVLMVDAAADQAFQLAATAEGLRRGDGPSFFLVASDRTNRMQHLEEAFYSQPIESKSLSPLTRDEAVALTRKLREIGQLGLLASKKDVEIADRIERRHLLEALLSLGSADSLKARLVKELQGFGAEGQLVYSVASLAHACGYPASIAVVRRAASIDPPRLVSLLHHELRDNVFVADGRWLETRHRVVAEILTFEIDRAACLDAAVRLARALGPYVNRRAIMRGEPEARLAGRLLDYDRLARLFDSSSLQYFYDSIKADWSWNSRYWEQRALMEVDTDPELAVRHAEHAVGIELHPFPLTTLATVRVKASQRGAFADEALFWSGIQAAEEAIELAKRSRRRELHPYDVAIRGACAFALVLAERGSNLRLWPGWQRINTLVQELSRFDGKSARALVGMWSDAKARFGIA